MPQQSYKRKLILASSSPYRKMLLDRLGIPFKTCSPEINESPLDKETPEHLVARLARRKAAAIARQFPGSVVIGSDQVAVCTTEIVGKPGNASVAVRQLQRFSGKTVQFLTAIHVFCKEEPFAYEDCVVTEVCFRELTREEIERYVAQDRPFDCAGGFKSEAAGIGLLSSMTSPDPTAIIGLPLISTAEALRQAGFRVP